MTLIEYSMLSDFHGVYVVLVMKRTEVAVLFQMFKNINLTKRSLLNLQYVSKDMNNITYKHSYIKLLY